MIQIKSNWKNLKGVDAWLPELKQLLAEANASALQADPAVRLKVSQFLTGFIQESWPQSPEMDRLDDLAQETITGLMMGDINARLGAIASRTADYAKLSKDMEAQSERNLEAADSIRLKGIQQLIDTTTATINSAKALASSLNAANVDDKKVAALVKETIEAIENLRTKAAGLI